MNSFDINGAIIEFDEKLSNYNYIRKTAKENAMKFKLEFEEYCFNNLHTLKQISDRGFYLGQEKIENALKKCVELIINYKVMTVDIEVFKDSYANKYLDYFRQFSNLNKEALSPYKNKRNTRMSNVNTRSIIEKLSRHIYDDCFNLHLAVLDCLLDNGVLNIGNPIKNDDIKKATALFNNYKEGLISQINECRVIQQIIMLNPYKEDLYEYLVMEEGDVEGEIDRFTKYIGYNLDEYKADLMDIYINSLLENNISDIEVAKEKVHKYSRYIGCSESAKYIARIDAIYTFEKV